MIHAQKDKWILYPAEVDFDAGPTFDPVNFPNPSTSLITPYVQENAVYDADGSLLFYYQEGNIFNAQGELEGINLSYIGSGNGEVVILPVPGECRRNYYIFTIHTHPSVAFTISMQEVTVNSDGSLFVNTDQILDGGIFGMLSGNTGSIGASKIIPGTAADRFMYVAINTMGQVRRYRVTNTGVAFDVVEATFSQNNGPSSELEISPDGNWMAWSVDTITYLYQITATTPTPINMQGIVNGLEFSHDSKFLLASVEGQGIAVISVVPPNNHAYIPNSSNFGKTYIEAGKDGKMYCVHRNGNLYEIWSDLNTMMATELTVYSNEPGIANMTRGGYTLPDQIDGEGDEFFYNVPPLIITDLAIEALSIPQAVGGVVPAFYNCDNIDLSVDYSGQATDYMVRIYSVDPVTGTQVFGSPFLDYTGTFSGAPPAFIDLRCIDDPVNCDLFDGYLTQTFAVEIRLDGACTKRARLGYFRVFGAPSSPADIKLQINAGNGPICSASHNPATPCAAGLFSGAVSLSNSNGDITYYRIDIDETDCTTGAVIQNLYSGPITQVSSIPALVFGFNSFEINGSTGYFILNNFLNRCIRVSAEVGNNCGSSTDFSYVLFNGAYRYGDPDRFNISNDAATLSADDTGNESTEAAQQGNEGEALRTVLVFPNPARDAWQFQFSGPLSGPGNITLTDAIGRTLRVLRVDAGVADISIQTHGLVSGAYYYRIQTEETSHSGILLKH